MTNDFTAIGMTNDRGERCAISANAAKVLETTRRAWNEASAQAPRSGPCSTKRAS